MSEELKSILDYFPLEKPRATQAAVIKQIHQAITDGTKVIILEAPVGSGKSAIAMTIARWLDDAHVLTPRKSLQGQYFDDFNEDVVLMKGRGAYPCSYHEDHKFHKKVIKLIEKGNSPKPIDQEHSTAQGPCRNSPSIFRKCMDEFAICPYHAAIEVAQKSGIIVHNLHSFIFQAHFGSHFEKRKVMIIDEAHQVENIIRGFTIKKVRVAKLIEEQEEPGEFQTLAEWADYFDNKNFLPKNANEEYITTYYDGLEKMRSISENFGSFIVERENNTAFNETRFKFIPESIGNMASTLLFNYGETVILMSGTIYDKRQFCKNVGLNSADAMFIKVGSSFPLKSRPIYMKDDYMVDTSHKMWDDNFGEIIEKINTVCDKFPDVKGLIHAPSYDAAMHLTRNLVMAGNNRIVMHQKDDFQEKLNEFFQSTGNDIFVSPVCSEGVDFKGDRARFQIILRVPYANTGDAFMGYKVKTDFPWYNYQALVTFGQQIGRVNRSENDFGVTVLIDSRFVQFVNRNRNILPKWLMDAIIR